MMTNFRFLYGLLLATCFVACRSDQNKPFDPYGPGLNERLNAYNNVHTAVKKETPGLFIDFSAGINNAFKTSTVSSLLSECFNTILTDKFEVYKLGSNEVTPLPVTNTTQLGQEISNQSNYKDIWAPIQKAVDHITDADNDALLITDFEEWMDKVEVTNTAYLKLPFKKWLAKGYTINFFIVDYKEGNVNKHIYFTIFNSSNNLLAKLAPKLTPYSTRFDLSTSSFSVSTNYADPATGGIVNDKNILDFRKDQYIKNESFEYYPLGLGWKDIADVRKDDPNFTDIFRNLFIDLSNQDSYSFKAFDVQTFNVTADFENFAKTDYALHHPPATTKGKNGETRISDDEKDQVILECYNDDGTLKPNCKYQPQTLNPLPNYFRLNQPLFENTSKSNNKHVELGIIFDPHFSPSDADTLLRVNIVLTGATPNVDNPTLQKFKWVNAKGTENTALYQSVINTLQELTPANKTIYTYYIKTNQN
ncbi:hypothetical protein [Chitinophaga sp.]|uniref:hypothetical protein n=1 Tax=Chitinophaga sp. TaxID=1869181 RepID=UPI0031E251B4